MCPERFPFNESPFDFSDQEPEQKEGELKPLFQPKSKEETNQPKGQKIEQQSQKDQDLISFLESNGAGADVLEEMARGNLASAIDIYVVPICDMYVANPSWAESNKGTVQSLISAIHDLQKNHRADLKFGTDKVVENFLRKFDKK